MKRKVLCSILAILIVLASFPLTAFAADGERKITKIELTATKPLIENYDGYWCENDAGKYFYYEVPTSYPDSLVTYSDGSTETVKWDNFWEYFYTFNIGLEQGAGEKELKAGNKYTTSVTIGCEDGDNSYDVSTTLEFEIAENPVKSVSVVAKSDLVENVTGEWNDLYDENGEISGKYFCYNISSTDYVATIEYKDGRIVSGTESEIYDQTGGYGIEWTHDQKQNPFSLGENTIKVTFLGVESEFKFNIVEDPIESITVTKTKDLIENKSGYFKSVDYEDESKGKWFNYALNETEPTITVKYKNGDTVSCTYDACYDTFNEYIDLYYEQSPEKPLTVGTYTGKASILGHECDFVFSIVENPIKSISVNVPDVLEEYVDGYIDDGYGDDGMTIIGKYFAYEINDETTTITINYADASKASETYKLSELFDVFDEGYNIDLGQNYKNQLGVGKHKGKLEFMGVSCEFDFEIIANTVKSISVKATSELEENVDGYISDEGDGEYFHYYIYNLDPEFTVTYTDGTVKTYTLSELYEMDVDFSIDIEQSAEAPLKPGTHTATASFNGITCDFTYKILEDPIKSVSIKATRDLVEYTDGYFSTGYDDEEYFYYDLDNLNMEVTITYKDGTVKTYDRITLHRFTDYDLFFDDDQAETPYKLGENKATVFLNGHKEEITFNIVKQSNSQKVKSLVVTPDDVLIENTEGWWSEEYDEETDEVKDYYHYLEEAITYTATITFEDGTTKTYKNILPYSSLDGSDLDIYFGQNENPYKVGKNTAVASYRNAKCEFQVEVVENNYTAVAISGYNELVITLTKADGTKENYTADNFEIRSAGETEYAGVFYSGNKTFDIVISYGISEDEGSFENIQLSIFEDEKKLTSNVLEANEWLDMLVYLGFIDECAAVYADGYSNRFYGREFTGVSGDFTGAEIDDILSLCTYDVSYSDYENTGMDEIGYYVILSVEEAEDLVGGYFDISKIDFTSSPMYNAGAKEIKVYFIRWSEGDTEEGKLEYKNGKFVYITEFNSGFTENSHPVTVVLDANGYVESISFAKGVCGTVGTINATNANGGVNVTFSAAENALEYEIYRSLNGGEFEKIATTSELSYLDKTAVSGKTYTYKVRAINSNSQGAYSTTKTIVYVATPTFTVSQSNAGFSVKWNKVEGATSYIVYRADFVNGKWSAWKVLSTPKASVLYYADKAVVAGGTYKYTVRAVSDKTNSYFVGSNTLVFLKTPSVKIANAKDGVRGVWTQVAGAQGYTIYRSELVNGKWSAWYSLGTADATDKSFTDITVVSGKTYRYTVRAVAGVNKSQYVASNSVLYITEPTVTASNSKSGIAVKWTKSGGATGYTVYRSQYNATTKKWSSWKNMGTAKADKSAWTDKSAVSGVTYRYTVRAVLGDNRSSYTATSALVRLAQPTVKVVAAKKGVTVSWNKVAGATGYAVFRSTLVNGKWTAWQNIDNMGKDATSCADKSVNSGTTYRYTVRARAKTTLSSYTASSQIMVLSEPVVKVSNYSTGVRVTWNKVEGAQGYAVYSSTYNTKTKKWSSWTARGTAKATATSWVDRKAESGVQYRYAVRAVNGKFKSTYTATSGIVYLAQPVVTVAKSTNSIAVTWTKSAGATSYVVYRQTSVDGTWSAWQTVGTTKSAVNTFADKTATAGTTYRYTVRAVRGNAKSAYTASSQIAF